MIKVEKIIEKILTFICSLFMVVMVLCTFAQVVRRALFGSAFLWTEECAIWSMMWMMFLGSGLCILNDKHAKIDFLVNKMPEKTAAIVRIIGFIACGAISVVLMYYALPVVKLNARNFSVGLKIPWAIYYSAFPASGVLMALCFVFRFIREIKSTFLKKEDEAT